MEDLSALVIGSSSSEICGVRDYAGRMSDELLNQGISITTCWWNRAPNESLSKTSTSANTWQLRVNRHIADMRPSAIVLHYSAFAFSFRGIPICFRGLMKALDPDIPLITILHEYAYPWHRNRWKGIVWGISQRAVLRILVRNSTSLVVTTSQRRDWIASRRYLPDRPTAVSPVFSNLPPPTSRTLSKGSKILIGLFGYGQEGTTIELTLQTLARIHELGFDADLRLLGSPGAHSPIGHLWRAIAAKLKVLEYVDFTGVLDAQVLSDSLASCDILLLMDTDGPTARKTTLAASLGSGRPVIAIDGPNAWSDIVESNALIVTEPTVAALSVAIITLVNDPDESSLVGRRGLSFAGMYMSLSRSTKVITDLIEASVC